MGYWSSLLSGLGDLGQPLVIAVILAGTLAGLFVGAIPGLGGIVVLVLLLPFLYNMNPVVGLALLLAAHSAIYYAGSTTAILINTPGAPESAATCFDGYAMTRRGRTAEALGISAAATTFGGWFGAVVLVAAIPFMVPLITLFHPPSYFFLAILAVVIIGQLQAKSPTKGLLSGLFGFLLSFFGAAPSTGTLRFTFGNLGLYSGINIATAAIGLFAISEMFVLFAKNRRISEQAKLRLSRDVWKEVGQGVREVGSFKWLTLRSALLGFVCGIIPGIGSTAANFLSYGQAVQTSKHPERFGTGIPEGIVAPEASSISKEAGALLPTVALGVPTGPGMAVLLAAFAILGLAPGESMVKQHLSLVFLMVVVIAVAALLASAVGLALAPVLAKITTVPSRVLVPFVLALAAIGAFASTTLLLQVLIMMLLGVTGLLLKRFGYSLPAVIVGLVLGTVAENNLILTTQLYGWRTFENWLPDALMAAIVAVLVLGARSRRRQATRQQRARSPLAQADPVGGDGDAREARVVAVIAARSWGELLLDLAWVAGAAGYVYLARRFPSPASLAPTYLGLAVLAVAVFQLLGGFVPPLRRFTLGTGVSPRAEASTTTAALGLAAQAATPEAGGTFAARMASGSTVPGSSSAAPPAQAVLKVVGAGTLLRAVGDSQEPEGPATDPSLDKRESGEALKEFLCILLALALVGGIYLFGYQIAIPAFTLLYFVFVYRWVWWRSIVAAVVMAGAAYAAAHLLAAIFPSGIV